MSDSVRRAAIGTWHFLRGACLVAGMTIVLLLFAELCVRIGNRLSGSQNRRAAVPESYRKAGWYPDFARDQEATTPQRWLPYVYFGRRPSFHSATVNIDSLGRRVTPQPSTPSVPAARVFFFGGSTLWGTAQRDDHTIPAEASHRLQELAGAGARVDVTNFGESGYVSTQGVLKLMLQLRNGDRPDVVVFYDGINDVYGTVQAGVPGVSQNEFKRAAEFDMGRAIDRNVVVHSTGRDLHAVRILLASMIQQSALVNWIESFKPSSMAYALISTDSAAHSTARMYAENIRLVESLSKTYGFTPIYVWQPTLHGTDKAVTPFEARLLKGIASDSFQSRLQAVHHVIGPMIDSAAGSLVQARFVNASGIFRGDSSDVFMDRIGHNTEQAVPKIVDAFWPVLKSAVEHAITSRRR